MIAIKGRGPRRININNTLSQYNFRNKSSIWGFTGKDKEDVEFPKKMERTH